MDGYWVGFGEHCGDAMTHKILDHETQKIIYRSAFKPRNLLLPTNQEGTPKMKHMLIFWEMRDSSMSFTPICPKPSHHTIHKV